MTAGRLILLCGVLAALWPLSALPVTAESWPTARILQSVVRLTVEIDGSAGSCTGFSVGGGRIVTADHCAKGTIVMGALPLDVIEADMTDDLAVLQMRQDIGLPALVIGREPRQGDATLAVGYPLTSPRAMVIPSTFQGVFDGFADDSLFAMFIGNTMPGMSGGPIVDTRGAVVSVILGGGNPATAYQSMAFGARHAALRKMLLKWRED